MSNQLITLAIERAAKQLGARIIERAPVTHVDVQSDQVSEVQAGDNTYTAPTIVLAAGARSGQIAKRMRLRVPVMPVRGQMIALGGMSAPIRHAISGLHGYLVPRANGLIFVGATVEHVGFRRRTTREGIRRMRSLANTLVPQLAAAKQHFEWAGLRPGTPDDMPIIGPVGASNVIAATGHYRNGILLGPITGRWVATGIVDGDWSAVPQEFAPSRFG